MSDFLTSLAARALRTVSVVQPRLAARFETPSVGGRFSSHDLSGEELEIFSEAAPPLAPLSGSARTSSSTAIHSEPLVRPGERRSGWSPSQDGLPESPDSTVTHSPPHTSSAGTPARHSDLPRESLTEAASPSLLQNVTRHLAPAVPFPQMAQHATADSLSSTSLVDSLPAAKTTSELLPTRVGAGFEGLTVSGSRRRPDDSKFMTATPPSGGPIVAIPRLTPVPAPMRDLTRQTPAPESTPEPGPTIRVTIGRVEVRAVLPPAPVPQRPRETSGRNKSLLTLEDYLRQRTEQRK